MIFAVLAVLVLSSLFLLAYGFNLVYLAGAALRVPRAGAPRSLQGGEPRVCVQVPIYNEHHVAERLVEAVARLDWPLDRLEIQVLDDSDDDTVGLVATRVRSWRSRGVDVTHVRRPERTGYKAGALANGMRLTTAPFLVIFDADFLPSSDFLRRTLGAFQDPAVGFVQARWTNLNESYSFFTRLQALMVEFHFQVEQLIRPAHGFFTNFTGSAGVWRRAAIEAAGGWSARTLTEDLDLSYRAQLAGWRGCYLEAVEVGQELPVDVNGYRGQQARWASGSFQTARSLLPRVLRAPLPARVKFQATMHLLAYLAPILMLLQVACYPALLLLRAEGDAYEWVRLPVFVNLLSLAPAIGLCVAQVRQGRTWWSRLPIALCWSLLGAGTSYTVLLAFVRSFRRGAEFVRTPKYRIEQPGQEWRDSSYVRALDSQTPQEALLGVLLLAVGVGTVAAHWWLLAVYSLLFAGGLLGLASISAYQGLEVLALRRLGLGALRTVRRWAPALGLFALAAGLLAAFTRLPDPFEDSYQHWLLAANLAATGRLRDPIFSMQDTWLPGYQVLAAGVLKVFGLWRLDLLKVLGALIGFGVLACVHQLAPNQRQARIAVLLLALNPVFLLVSTDAVAEPLLTLLLAGAALAGVRGRSARAAILCLAACLVGTKAWLWVGALGAVSVLPWVLRTRPGLRPGLAWAPALAVAAGLQLGFAPASHSAARAAQEVASATARGSLPLSPLGRLWELISTYGLATLPLALAAPAGFVAIKEDRARLRWLHLPSLIYLAVVVLLVTAGAYSGSHRYLYVALPSLALLAAALLDRAPAPAWVVSAAAAGLLTAGFVPVFQSFAAANRGLEAAGVAASSTPGRLLTDSPVAAYFSHKPPDEIAGSMVLPPDRTQALAWLRGHGYTSVVLEGISYYRATAIFPDLVAGAPRTGFLPLGAERSYSVAGGKAVFAYSVLPVQWSAPLFGDVRVAVAPRPADGKSAPLAKGAYLVAGGRPLAGEGMGLGVPVVRFADGWWYPGTAATTDGSGTAGAVWTRVFQLDTAGGDAAHSYRFVRTASRGRIEVTYQVVPGGLAVGVRVLWLAPGALQTGILNEQSAAFDDFAEPGRTLVGPAFGRWEPVTGAWARLRSAAGGVEWSLPQLAGAELDGGRELTGNLDWAGLDYLFGPAFGGTTYTVHIQEAR